MSTTPRQAPPLFSPEPAPRGSNLTALWLVALGAICAVALGLQIYHFWPFMANGAYVSPHYRPAAAARAWIDGERSAAGGGRAQQFALGLAVRRIRRARHEAGDRGAPAGHCEHGRRHCGHRCSGVPRLSGKGEIHLQRPSDVLRCVSARRWLCGQWVGWSSRCCRRCSRGRRTSAFAGCRPRKDAGAMPMSWVSCSGWRC